jgi:tetratricopeptide (TPR) repeat protein
LSEARQLFGRAVGPSEAAADARLLAGAALGLGGVWVEEERDELSRRRMLNLCRRALAALPADEAVLAARIGVRLAVEEVYDGAATAGDVAAAVDRVRRLGDPTATAEALSLYHHALLLPEKASARLQVADELLDVASNAEATMYSLFGLCWRTVDLYHLGDREAERAFFDLRERAAALGSQSVGYIVAVVDVMRSLRRGEFDRAEALAVDALALGTAAGDADALAYYGAHLLTLRWMQGRVGELLEPIQAVIESSTLRRRDQIYHALLAYAHVLRGDHAVSRSVLDGLLIDGTGSIPEFSTWAGTVAILVETAAELGDGELALALAKQFEPVAHLPVMPSLAVTCLGPGERVIGRALTTAGRLDEGIGWLRAALASARRIGNRPFAVLIRADLAAALDRRAGPGDAETSAWQIASAIREGRELGMAGWVARWEHDGTTPDDHDEVEVLQGMLERENGTWRLSLGGRAVVVRDVVGMRYIAELVAHPDTDIRACDLSAAVVGGGPVDAGPVGPVSLDDRARDEYRRRLVQLEHELDAADRSGDLDRGRRAAHERDFLVATLRRETGLGGHPRRMVEDAERCRMRVSKAVHRALDRIGQADPALGRALESRIRTGYVCRYLSDPGQPIAWTVRPTGRARSTSPD